MQTHSTKAYGLKLVSPLIDMEMVEKHITIAAHKSEKIILDDSLFATYHFHVEAGSTLHLEEKIGKENVKRHIYVCLDGVGAEVKLESRADVSGTTVVDSLHSVIHKADDTKSEIILKGIVDDEARAIYRSTITADPGVQDVVGKQSAQFLTFSSKARIDAIPALEVSTDSITCSHSFGITTVREVDIFYLQARGYSCDEAKSVLREGFLMWYL